MFHFIFLFNKGLIYNSWFDRLYTSHAHARIIYSNIDQTIPILSTLLINYEKKRTFGNSLMIHSLSDSRFLELNT